MSDKLTMSYPLTIHCLSYAHLSVVLRSSLGEIPMRFRSDSDEVPMETKGKLVANRRLLSSGYLRDIFRINEAYCFHTLFTHVGAHIRINDKRLGDTSPSLSWFIHLIPKLVHLPIKKQTKRSYSLKTLYLIYDTHNKTKKAAEHLLRLFKCLIPNLFRSHSKSVLTVFI